jgi:hypothetical protein
MHNYILDTISSLAIHAAPSRFEVSGDVRLPTHSTCRCDGAGRPMSNLGTMGSMSVCRTLLLVASL